tara:strand:- start:533 stop:760 length:228 start_codon:yes stop_codon:yes gene_type:complete
LDKVKEILLKLLEKIQDVEEIASHNNNLLGFMLSQKQSSAKFNPGTKKLMSIYLDSEMLAYLEENNISLDSFGDA